MPRDRLLPVAALAVSLASCGAPPTPSRGTGVARYQGLTTCGAPVSPALPSAEPYGPEIEPMPWSRTPTAPAAGPARIEPAPSTDVIDARFHGRATELRACAERHFARHPDEAPLRVDTRFEVRADGRVAGAEVRGDDAELDRCVCDAIATIDFRGIGGRALASYPLMFSR